MNRRRTNPSDGFVARRQVLPPELRVLVMHQNALLRLNGERRKALLVSLAQCTKAVSDGAVGLWATESWGMDEDSSLEDLISWQSPNAAVRDLGEWLHLMAVAKGEADLSAFRAGLRKTHKVVVDLLFDAGAAVAFWRMGRVVEAEAAMLRHIQGLGESLMGREPMVPLGVVLSPSHSRFPPPSTLMDNFNRKQRTCLFADVFPFLLFACLSLVDPPLPQHTWMRRKST